MAQPVVRFTGERDGCGALRDGFLTAFVNVSCVQPIHELDQYATAFDQWLSVLSRLGLHARHITLDGRLAIWRRREVEGITLRFRHAGLALGDIVLLWNADDPDHMAVDLGTGLERLAWARSRHTWPELIFGTYSEAAPVAVLDAIRTATLLLGHGIIPASRGPGSITRRVLATIPPDLSPLGISAAIRSDHDFWTSVEKLPAPWPAVTQLAEKELRRRRNGLQVGLPPTRGRR
ncbi:hypothetical protein WKI65_22400 [Streptomyces sp. MS1.AVA.3]|uniref:hypothetical protein n=1 Tax=Streptomyces decoyicus TaxID=249567 RepID=UPI0030BBE3F3